MLHPRTIASNAYQAPKYYVKRSIRKSLSETYLTIKYSGRTGNIMFGKANGSQKNVLKRPVIPQPEY